MNRTMPVVAVATLLALLALPGCARETGITSAPEDVQDDFKAFAPRMARNAFPGESKPEEIVSALYVDRVAGRDFGTCTVQAGRKIFRADFARRDGTWVLDQLKVLADEGDLRDADEATAAKFRAAAEAANQP